MPKLEWDATGSHFYESGVDHGVYYPVDTEKNDGSYKTGVAWNGLTAFTDSPSGADATDFWADNIKYASLRAAEEAGGTIEAYTYPEEFNASNGFGTVGEGVYAGQQSRLPFGFSCRTYVGSDTKGSMGDYILHLVYNMTVSPSERSYQTHNDSPDAVTFSWEFEATPVNTGVDGLKPTATIDIDSRKVPKEKLTKIENKLYGDETDGPTLLLPKDIKAILDAE